MRFIFAELDISEISEEEIKRIRKVDEWLPKKNI